MGSNNVEKHQLYFVNESFSLFSQFPCSLWLCFASVLFSNVTFFISFFSSAVFFSFLLFVLKFFLILIFFF